MPLALMQRFYTVIVFAFLSLAATGPPGLSLKRCVADAPVVTAPARVETSHSGIKKAESLRRGIPLGDGAAYPDVGNRLWLISTRHMAKDVRRANLQAPAFRIYRLDSCGRQTPSSFNEYLASLAPHRPAVVYVHGNRMRPCDAVERGIYVYRHVLRRYQGPPVDWVIWSWPSEQSGILLADAREKARRTDTQGLYLAWLLRRHHQMQQPTTLIGYSFGARVISGSLHALAGGTLRRRALPGERVMGAAFDVGMIAPALGNDWLSARGYHRLATQNLDQITVLYNQRDAILRTYWRVDRLWNADALGYTGPRSFARRFDGSRTPVRSRDCSAAVGIHHDELDYYDTKCAADCEMAKLVRDALVRHP